jgi:hypothetical protein
MVLVHASIYRWERVPRYPWESGLLVLRLRTWMDSPRRFIGKSSLKILENCKGWDHESWGVESAVQASGRSVMGRRETADGQGVDRIKGVVDSARSCKKIAFLVVAAMGHQA